MGALSSRSSFFQGILNGSDLPDAFVVGAAYQEMDSQSRHERQSFLVSPAQYSSYSSKSLITSCALIVCVWAASRILYNIYFHPLAKYPGPLLARATLTWRLAHSLSGRLHIAIQKQHNQYGPVLRISPNELSFASVSSLKSIYGHRSDGKAAVLKSEHYDMLGAGFGAPSIGSERNPHDHNEMRKSLSSALSQKAATDREGIVHGLIDKFILRLESHGVETKINLTHWYDYLTLDILGALAFSQPFGCLEYGNSSAWPSQMVEYMSFATLADNLRRLPLIGSLIKAFFQSDIPKQNPHSRRSRERVTERLENRPLQDDFFTKFIQQYDNGVIEKEQLAAHAATLIVGGSETTSTFLAATTYHLLKNEKSYERLKCEIRGAFRSYSDIDVAAAQKLPYLQAVIAEGLRICPPLSLGFPRLSPGMFVDNFWIPKGTEIFTSYWTVTHSEKYFSDPYKFNPDRWLDPNSTDVKEASQPFSLGSRACSGRTFAYMELNLIIAKMAWKYNLELVDEGLDWDKESRIYLLWVRPDLSVRCIPHIVV